MRATSVVLLGAASTATKAEWPITDYEVMALQVQGPSAVTLSLSISGGAPLAYSVVSTVHKGLFGLKAGARWLKVERVSGTTVLLNWSY